MKLIISTITLITLLASCESAKQDLSNPTSRNEIMTAIANDHTMSNEMMAAMMSGPNGKTMMGNPHMMDMMHKMNGQNMNGQGMNMQNMKGMKGN